jgi:hypothetical protein
MEALLDHIALDVDDRGSSDDARINPETGDVPFNRAVSDEIVIPEWLNERCKPIHCNGSHH